MNSASDVPRLGLCSCTDLQTNRYTHLHVNEAQDLNTDMCIHLKHLIELAHLEQHGAVKVLGFELPPEQAEYSL